MSLLPETQPDIVMLARLARPVWRIMADDLARWNGEEIAGQWLAMAERRRDDLLELYRCGRWRRYHTEAELLALMRAVKADIEFWSRFVRPPPKNLRQATG